MLLVIVGKSGSGKNAVSGRLLTPEMGCHRIVTFTTRPMRPGEKEGVDYHFVSDEKFSQMVARRQFAEWKEYHPACGDVWKYGSRITADMLNSDEIYLIILTPAGLRDIKKKFRGHEEDIASIYLRVPEETLKKRLKGRGDDTTEAVRRLAADKKDFDGFESSVDYVIDNTGSIDETVGKIADIISDRFIE